MAGMSAKFAGARPQSGQSAPLWGSIAVRSRGLSRNMLSKNTLKNDIERIKDDVAALLNHPQGVGRRTEAAPLWPECRQNLQGASRKATFCPRFGGALR